MDYQIVKTSETYTVLLPGIDITCPPSQIPETFKTYEEALKAANGHKNDR